jgi:hypothetical protein
MDHIAILLLFLRNLYTAIHNGCTNLHSNQQCITVPVSLNPHQHLFVLLFLKMVILTEVKRNLRVVFNCISSMAREEENFLMYFLVIFTYSLKNSLFNSHAQFVTWDVDSLGNKIFEFPLDSAYKTLTR